MLRIDGRVLVASVLGVFLVGAVLGFAVGGMSGQSGDPGDAATPAPTPSPAPAPTAATTVGGTATAVRTGTVGPTAAGTGTLTPTSASTDTPTPTASPTATVVPDPTPTPTRTPMLIRRFDTEAIERHLRRLINDWRVDRGLDRFTQPEGRVVRRLDRMATAHSVDMADLGETVHRIDNRSSAGRYREYGLFHTCKFKRNGSQYIVTPTRNRLEVLGKTYAGTAYETPNGTRYNGNEREVARAVFENWVRARPFRDRLSYANATRIGIGIETTENNEVYVTGNLCGVPGPSS
ncbi:MAG: CAP domain-containing protein [Halosimplex sp.]